MRLSVTAIPDGWSSAELCSVTESGLPAGSSAPAILPRLSASGALPMCTPKKAREMCLTGCPTVLIFVQTFEYMCLMISRYE